MFVSLMLPLKAMAAYYDGYQTLNLKEALAQEEIELVNKNYKETNDQAIIYLFRGNGCGYCRNLLTYLSSLTEEYGKYFKVVSFEVWNDAANNALMSKVSTITGVAANGVPYYIIGGETFDGYNESYNERIVNAIMKQYQDNSEDVFEKLDELENGKSTDTFAIIFWNAIIVFAAVGLNIYFASKNRKQILAKIDELKKNDNKKK